MKVLVISTNVFPVPLVGYGGLEQLVYHLAEGLHRKGHKVSVAAPNGSRLSEDVELIGSGQNEDEEKSWQRYKGRLESSEWEVVVDASWQRWATMSNVGREPQIPIINFHHSDPSIYQTPAPIPHNLWVGLSRSHAENLGRHFRIPTRYVYNGIDTQFYRSDGRPRNNHYLWLARYTYEKGAAEIINLAKKLKVVVDMYGDTSIVGDQGYVQMCRNTADGLYARVSPGISREETVNQYSTHKGYLYWLNWSEPFGLSILEAQACGCVPIVSRRGAAPELIKHGETGFLVDTLEEMEELVKKDAVKEINLETMRKHVESKFSVERFVDDWEKLLLSVVSGERW